MKKNMVRLLQGWIFLLITFILESIAFFIPGRPGGFLAGIGIPFLGIAIVILFGNFKLRLTKINNTKE